MSKDLLLTNIEPGYGRKGLYKGHFEQHALVVNGGQHMSKVARLPLFFCSTKAVPRGHRW